MKTKQERAEELADKLILEVKKLDIQFIHGDEEMKKKLVKVLLKERMKDEV